MGGCTNSNVKKLSDAKKCSAANFYNGRMYEGTYKVIYRGHCPFLRTKPLIK